MISFSTAMIAMAINKNFKIGHTFNLRSLKQILNIDRDDYSKTQLIRFILESLVKSGFLSIDESYRTNRYKKIREIDVQDESRSIYIVTKRQ